MLPPKSQPNPKVEPPAAMMAASPPLLPPGVRDRSQGLLVRPQIALSVSTVPSVCGIFVFPRMMAPASRKAATSGPSAVAILFFNLATPNVVGHPFI